MEKIVDRFTQIIEKKTVGEKRIKVLNKFVGQLDYDCEYRDQVKEIVESLEVGDVDEKILKKMQKLLKKISDANEPETNDEVSDNEVTCEIVSTQIKVEEVEKELDSYVKKYCGFSEKKPMDYVGYNIAKESYVCQYPKKNKCLKNKDKICNFALENIRHNFRTSISEIMSCKKACLPYRNKNLMIFTTQNVLLFDIQHLLSILDIDERMMEKKYKEFSPKITNFMCVKNEFGGYIIRELIPEEVMYEIILSSNSEFSKSFKKDVSMILNKLKQSETNTEVIIRDDTVPEKQYDINTSVVNATDDEIITKVDEESGYKISKEHPMEGVSYEKDRDKYDCVIDGKHNRSNSIHKVCELKRKYVLGNLRHGMVEISQTCKRIISYQNKHIISFWYKHENEIEPLFDVRHILKLLDVSARQCERIHNIIKDDSKHIYFEPNKYDGYTVRELIDEKMMYQIVLDSRSKFSQSFKSDISDMLINLRKNGDIQLAIIPQQRQRRTTISHYDEQNLFISDQNNMGMKSTNEEHMKYINELIRKGQNIRVQQYNGKHVLYFFITNIKHDEYIICKIGYTSDIIGRIANLPTEYDKSEFHLIGIKCIKNEHREKKFHSSIKHRYPQLKYEGVEINDTRKTELYIFDKCLFEEFNKVTDRLSTHTSDTNTMFYALIEKSINAGVSNDILKLIIETHSKELEVKKLQTELELQKLKTN